MAIDGEKFKRPTEQDIKMKNLVAGDDEDEEMDESDHDEAPSKEKKPKKTKRRSCVRVQQNEKEWGKERSSFGGRHDWQYCRP